MDSWIVVLPSEYLFSGCANSSSVMVWLENQHPSYTLVPNNILVLGDRDKKQLQEHPLK